MESGSGPAVPAPPANVLLAMLAEAQRRRDGGDDDGAAEVLITAVAHAERTCGARSLAVAQLRAVLGVVLKATGAYDRARAECLAALSALAALAEHGDAVATLHSTLAGVDLARGDAALAAEWGRRGLAIRQSLHGDDDPRVLADQGGLASVLIALGAYAEAEALLAHVYARHVARRNDDEVARTLTSMGSLAAHRRDWTTAARHLREAVRIKRAVLGANHPEVLRTLVDLALVAEHEPAGVTRPAAPRASSCWPGR